MSQLTSDERSAAEVDDSRYEIERKLGEGGTGAVFLARDLETGEHVALKKLFRMDAKSVLRLKREFRSLVGVAHPNLVQLYDMGRANDCWFLTMEYLDGLDLTHHLAATGDGAPDPQRVLTALRQLAIAIEALHQRGMLHRDLKPSNVMVVGERVVVLDFGLVRELNHVAQTVTEDGAIAGTPAYMAPEQIRASELSAAVDWYAFGVIAYEAWSGMLPIDGSMLEILRNKLDSEPAALREAAPDAPAWLDALCAALLQRDPAARPRGDAVIAAFDRALAAANKTRPERAANDNAHDEPRTATENLLPTESDAQFGPFLGRHAELRKLWLALNQAERGQAVVAHVRGLSGAGKSALVEHFVEELETEERAGPLVLRSRCYELEQMPFKALDGVLDALVRHLARLDDLAVAQVLPHDVAALSQLFPVLERLPAVQGLIATARATRNAMNDRQCAELALRELLDRLARRQPIVIWVDDLQWGDLDSARILRSWMREPTQARILFVLSYRSDEAATSTCLASLLRPEADGGTRAAPEHHVDLAPLDPANIRELCERRLCSLPGAHAALIARIVSEADGSPFLAQQLTALAEAKLVRGDADVTDISLDALVAQTGALLPEHAQMLLAVLSVAGRPLAPKLLFRAAGVRDHGRALMHALRGLNLVRTRDVSGERTVEVYHDRVRERVQASLSDAERASIQAALFGVLEFSGKAEPDWLFALALGAGRRDEALRYARAAAERADAALAFERAAELYQACIELSADPVSAPLWNKLAVALVRARSGVKAAEAYLETAKRVPADESLLYVQAAATHLLRNGHFEQGEKLMHELLQRVHAPLPESDAGVIAALVWESTRFKLRGGMKYTLRQERDVPRDLLQKHDAFYACGVGMLQVAPLRGALLNQRALRCALEAGEPWRIVLGSCSSAMALAASGSVDAGPQVDRLLELVAHLCEGKSERWQAELYSARAVTSFYLSRVRKVLEPACEAERILRTESGEDSYGNYHLRYTVANVRISARCELGELRAAREELQELLREADATDNRLLPINLTTTRTYVEISEGRADLAAERLERVARELAPNRFGIVHSGHLLAVLYVACASGDYAWAQRYFEPGWKAWMQSPLRRSGILAVALHATRARMLLNQHVGRALPAGVLQELRRDLKAMQHCAVGGATAKRIEARIAYFAGDRARAAELFRTSAEVFCAEGMLVHEARSRFAVGALTGGEAGSQERDAALERLREFGFVDPQADVRAFTPELS